jgi:hypothetical protein
VTLPLRKGIPDRADGKSLVNQDSQDETRLSDRCKVDWGHPQSTDSTFLKGK